jgi:NitT/TauT family transport system ATP-binding protein
MSTANAYITSINRREDISLSSAGVGCATDVYAGDGTGHSKGIPTSQAIIEIIDVRKIFVGKEGAEFEAVAPLSLKVKEGEFVAIVGTSGCGKSTLLRIIAGLMPPTSGQVVINHRVITEPDGKTGIVFQSPVLLPWRTVRENIELHLDINGVKNKKKHSAEVDRLIALVGLEGFEHCRPFELSGGMQQRVALCRALIHNPPLLLMDEPFGALDAVTREQMNVELQRIWLETGKTVVLITHSITEAAFLADRIIVMSARPGRITAELNVKLPRPRDFKSVRDEEYFQVCDHVRALMNAMGMVE